MTPSPAWFFIGGLDCLEKFALEYQNCLWGQEAENTGLYLYRTALILASELIRPAAAARALSPRTKHFFRQLLQPRGALFLVVAKSRE